jgi:hypothetical protein
MYYIINRTTNQTTVHHGDWPNLNEQLTNGQDIIVVSLYSNTIKTPYMENDCWEWKDYDAPFLSSHMDTDYPEDEEYNDAYDFDGIVGLNYVIASTLVKNEETYVFPSNEHGDLLDLREVSALALRFGHDNWKDHAAAVAKLDTDEYKYVHVSNIHNDNDEKHVYNLYQRWRRENIIEIN